MKLHGAGVNYSNSRNCTCLADFDEKFRAKGLTTWTCPVGHVNAVLPSSVEIKEMNRTLLMHPEFYVHC